MFVVIYDARAMPYIPMDDEVVHRIKKSNVESITLYDDSLNESELTIKVGSMILLARETNNSLLFGKVEAVLMKNTNIVNANKILKIYYADVLQQRHAFFEALNKIEKINTPEANVLRATIYINLGKYKKASSECKKLIGKADLLVASTCLLHAESYQGNLLQSLSTLKKITNQFKHNSNLIPAWTLTALADMSDRLGDNNSSINYYQIASKANPNNVHVVSEMTDVFIKIISRIR